MDRRMFLRALSGAFGAVIAPAVALSTPMPALAIAPETRPLDSAELKELLRDMARQVAQEIERHRTWSLIDASHHSTAQAVYPELLHPCAHFLIVDPARLRDLEYARWRALECAHQLCDAIGDAMQSRPIALLVQVSLPDVLPGLGAMSVCHTSGVVSVRAVASYDPNTLSQMISFDMLFGLV